MAFKKIKWPENHTVKWLLCTEATVLFVRRVLIRTGRKGIYTSSAKFIDDSHPPLPSSYLPMDYHSMDSEINDENILLYLRKPYDPSKGETPYFKDK